MAQSVVDQDYVLRQWDQDDGLPLITVKEILQSHDGHLWLGTWDGLSRFDGVRFTNFLLVDYPELISANAQVFLEDTDGDLWIGTPQCLARLREGNFTVFDADDGLTNANVQSLCQDERNGLWIGTSDGLFRYSEGTFRRIPFGEDSTATIHALKSNQQGVWVASDSGLHLIDGNETDMQAVLVDHSIHHFDFDHHENPVVVLESGQLARIEGDGTLQEFLPLENSRITCITRLKDGRLWIGTSSSEIMKLSEKLSEQPKLIARLPGSEVHQIIEDREENVWIGASGGGLHRLTKRRFDVIGEVDGLPSRNLGCLYTDRSGTLWLGTFGRGVFRKSPTGWESVPIRTLKPRSGSIASICESTEGELWFVLYSGLYGMLRDGQFEPVGKVPGSRGACADPSGGVWISSGSGVVHWQNQKETERFDMTNGLSSNDVQSLTVDSSGALWVSTQAGLNRIEKGVVQTFGRKDGLGVDSLRYVYAGSDDSIWIATGGAGLVRYRDGTFTRLTMKHGLPSAFPTCMLEDGKGNLWIGTANGLAVANLEQLHLCLDQKIPWVTFQIFGKEDGLKVPTFGTGFHPPCVRTPDQKLWFVAGNQLAVFRTDSLGKSIPPPTVAIESIIVDGQDYATQQTLARGLTVAPGHERLSFHYSGIHLTAPEKLIFQVQLEGYDDWVLAYHDRQATYTKVPAGQYRFRVKAADVRGVWNETAATINVTILPPWWQTWWAYSLSAIAIIAALAGLYRWRIAHFKRATAARERFARQLIDGQEFERKRLASGLHDDLGQSLLVAKSQLALAQRSLQPDVSSNEHLTLASETLTNTLEDVRNIAHNLRPYELDRLGLTEAIKSMAARVSETAGLNLSISIDPIENLLPPDVEISLYRVLQESVTNVIKHAAAKNVELSIRTEKDRFNVSVSDDGVGFSPAGENEDGLGLISIRERIRMMGGELTIQSSAEAGTQIVAQIPLRQH